VWAALKNPDLTRHLVVRDASIYALLAHASDLDLLALKAHHTRRYFHHLALFIALYTTLPSTSYLFSPANKLLSIFPDKPYWG